MLAKTGMDINWQTGNGRLTMQEQTGYQPQIYQCPDCGSLMDEQDVGVRPPDADGTKELYCTMCNSNQLALVQ